MAVEILGGALVLMTAVAIHGSFRISSLTSTIRDIEKWAHQNEKNTEELERKLAAADASNRALVSINQDLQKELRYAHEDAEVQTSIAANNLRDATRWREHTRRLKAMASTAGKASAAARKARKDKTTERLRCGK